MTSTSVDWNLIAATVAVYFERLVRRSDTEGGGGCMGGRGFLGGSVTATTRSVLVGGGTFSVDTK